MRWGVLIVDDHPLVAEALELSLKAAYSYIDVGRVSSAAEAEVYARKHAGQMKLVLLDLMLPDADGFSALLRLQQLLPETDIAMISARSDSHAVSMARAFGAKGYLRKTQSVSELVKCVDRLFDGETVFPEDAVADPEAVDVHKRMATLSGAQLKVLRSLADGKLNKQIAGEMNLTEGTVKQHVSAILKKLQVSNRSQAILAAGPFLRAGE